MDRNDWNSPFKDFICVNIPWDKNIQLLPDFVNKMCNPISSLLTKKKNLVNGIEDSSSSNAGILD